MNSPVELKSDRRIMSIKPCNHVLRMYDNPEQYRPDNFNSHTSIKTLCTHFSNLLQENLQKDEEIHAKNLEAINNNRIIRNDIEAYMNHIGMPKTYKERDYKSRARYPKYNTHTSGYLDDMSRNIPIDDGYSRVQESYKNRQYNLEVYLKKADEEEKAKEYKIKADKDKQADLLKLVNIIHRHSLPEDSTWSSVLEALERKSNLLALANAMYSVRCDWSDGCSIVEGSVFNPTTDLEKDILNSVDSAIQSFHECQDGRVFRDCQWNYDNIYHEVRKTHGDTFVDDAQMAIEKSKRY